VDVELDMSMMRSVRRAKRDTPDQTAHAPPAPEQQNAGSVPAGCQLVSALTLKTCHDILGGDLLSHAKKLHDSELYAIECANGVISFFARWGVAAAPLAPAEHGERPLPAGHLA
jgi:hypothetical protein